MNLSPRHRVPLLVVLALAAPLALASCSDPDDNPSGEGAVARVARDGRDQAIVEIADTADNIAFVSEDLGDDLLRVTTQEGSPLRPALRPTGKTRFVVSLTGTKGGAASVVVHLAKGVRWQIATDKVIPLVSVEMSSGHLAAMDIRERPNSLDLALPAPVGESAVRVEKGAENVSIETPKDAMTKVVFRKGAVTASVNGIDKKAVRSGQVIAPEKWDAAKDRWTIDLVEGVGDFGLDVAQDDE